MIKFLPYTTPLILPFLALQGIILGGFWVFSGFLIAYLIHPILDLLSGEDLRPDLNFDLPHAFHSFLLWIYVPIQTYFLFKVLSQCAEINHSYWEIFGIIISTGAITGGMGITVAHELVHRRARWERGLGVLLLSMVNYAHFRIEHVFGHHKHVATPEDPATARPGESLYRFLPRSVLGSWLSAWRIEFKLLNKRKRKNGPQYNRMIHYIAFQSLLAIVVGLYFGSLPLPVYILPSIVAFLTLEVINYIEHYGLERKEISPGVYEAVTEMHSWDSRHRMTNWFLFNLGRHAHHHAAPTVPYESLRPGKTKHALQYGYSTQMILAFIGRNNKSVSKNS